MEHFNYIVYVILMMIGLFAMITKNNLIKKLIGMSIFQTAIILFYVSLGVKDGAGIPIIHHQGHEAHYGEVAEGHPGPESEDTIDRNKYANPLPHVLMLTAIVVGVSTLGVALAVAQQIYRDFGSLEETEIVAQIKSAEADG